MKEGIWKKSLLAATFIASAGGCIGEGAHGTAGGDWGNAVTEQMLGSGDPAAIAAAIAPIARTLNTLSTYEGRKRRAAKSVQEDLAAHEQTLHEQRMAALKSNKTTKESEIGSVCSAPATAEEIAAYKDGLEAFFRELEAEVGPEEAAKIRKELGPEVA